MAKKEKEFKIKYSKDTNGAWSGYALIRKTNGQVFRLSVAANPEAKAISAKKFVKEILTEKVQEYLDANVGATRLDIEETEAE